MNQNGTRIKNARHRGRLAIRERGPARKMTEDQVVSAMYAYLMTSWDELPHAHKVALGFDSVVGGEREEVALRRLARIFMDYAELSCKRALAARRRRLSNA